MRARAARARARARRTLTPPPPSAATHAAASYFAREAAVSLFMPLLASMPAAEAEVTAQIERLEALKPALPAAPGSRAFFELVEKWAVMAFAAAEKEYRAGEATRKTAKNFYLAGGLLEALDAAACDEWQPMPMNRYRDMGKYAKQQVAPMLKAFAENTVPMPPSTLAGASFVPAARAPARVRARERCPHQHAHAASRPPDPQPTRP